MGANHEISSTFQRFLDTQTGTHDVIKNSFFVRPTCEWNSLDDDQVNSPSFKPSLQRQYTSKEHPVCVQQGDKSKEHPVYVQQVDNSKEHPVYVQEGDNSKEHPVYVQQCDTSKEHPVYVQRVPHLSIHVDTSPCNVIKATSVISDLGNV